MKKFKEQSLTKQVIQVILLTLIVIGIVLLATQSLWVPKVVNALLKSDGNVVPLIVELPKTIPVAKLDETKKIVSAPVVVKPVSTPTPTSTLSPQPKPVVTNPPVTKSPTVLRKYFQKDDVNYRFGVNVIKSESTKATLAYDLELIQFMTATTTTPIDHIHLQVVSEAGSMNIGEYYRLPIKYDSEKHVYVVTSLGTHTIAD